MIDDQTENLAFTACTIDVFVRPEQLHIVGAGLGAPQGTLKVQVYQGGHVDLHVRSAAVPGDLLVRTGDHETLTRWSVGATIDLSVDEVDATVFPAE